MLQHLIQNGSPEIRGPRRSRRPALSGGQCSGHALRRLERQIRVKFWFDCLATLVLLIPALPVIAVAWVVVKATSRGPGFFFQRRVGLNGREFWICKLRTMTVDCERHTGAVWAQPNDPRVTLVGRLLRATHLDELPQLYNVLRGEMSLVGPRPERPEIIKRLAPEIRNYADRLRVRPGVTGLAQISAKADLTIEDVKLKQRYDLAYIGSMSLWLDLRIIACTALKVCGLNRAGLRDCLFPGSSRSIAAESVTAANAKAARELQEAAAG
jgi:lipopolysaccharide/colanic/teichoic acid biosynthesis glycosyltransferase